MNNNTALDESNSYLQALHFAIQFQREANHSKDDMRNLLYYKRKVEECQLTNEDAKTLQEHEEDEEFLFNWANEVSQRFCISVDGSCVKQGVSYGPPPRFRRKLPWYKRLFSCCFS